MSLNSQDNQAYKKTTAMHIHKTSQIKQSSNAEKSFEKGKKEKKKRKRYLGQ